MKVEITEGFLKTLSLAAYACGNTATSLEASPQAEEESGVGKIIRERAEEFHQSKAMIEDFIKRVQRKEGLSDGY